MKVTKLSAGIYRLDTDAAEYVAAHDGRRWLVSRRDNVSGEYVESWGKTNALWKAERLVLDAERDELLLATAPAEYTDLVGAYVGYYLRDTGERVHGTVTRVELVDGHYALRVVRPTEDDVTSDVVQPAELEVLAEAEPAADEPATDPAAELAASRTVIVPAAERFEDVVARNLALAAEAPAHSVDLTVTAPDEPVDPAAEEAAAGHWPTGDEVDEALAAYEAETAATEPAPAPVRKPTAAQARFLQAIVADGGLSATAAQTVGGWKPIATAKAAGWVVELTQPSAAPRIMYRITVDGCEAIGVQHLPGITDGGELADCANCGGHGSLVGGPGAPFYSSTLGEDRNVCVFCKGTGKGTAAADHIAAVAAAASIDSALAAAEPAAEDVEPAAAQRIGRAYAQHAAQVAAGNPACQDRICAHLDAPAPAAALAPSAEPAGFTIDDTAYGAQLAAPWFTPPAPPVQLGLF